MMHSNFPTESLTFVQIDGKYITEVFATSERLVQVCFSLLVFNLF